jgi:hypothetical protein
MSARIDSVPGTPPVLSQKAPAPPVQPTDAVVAERALVRRRLDERVALWKAIGEAGSADAWVHQELTRKGFDPKESVPSGEAEKRAFKERRAAERVEKKALLALARDARRAATVMHLGASVHWDEFTDADALDVDDREQRREANGLPALETAEDLAQAMGLGVSKLRWFTYQRPTDTGTHYRRWSIPKRGGGQRTITSPKKDLMAAQRWALRHVFEKLPVHSAAHGFLPGRSVATNASVHAGASVILKVDLKDFFPTVTWRRVKGLLRKAGMAEPVATLLALLCTEAPRELVEFRGQSLWVATGAPVLPQGAPTSPAITNALCLKLDRRLSALATTLGFHYTRYADDLAFSWRRQPVGPPPALGVLMESLKAIVASEGFRLNPTKTAVLRPSACQRVTGLVVNQAEAGPAVRVPRDTIRRLRAAIHNRKQGKPGKADETLAQLEGMAAWIAMSDPKKGAALLAQIRALPR